jgi:hypothetical protein
LISVLGSGGDVLGTACTDLVGATKLRELDATRGTVPPRYVLLAEIAALRVQAGDLATLNPEPGLQNGRFNRNGIQFIYNSFSNKWLRQLEYFVLFCQDGGIHSHYSEENPPWCPVSPPSSSVSKRIGLPNCTPTRSTPPVKRRATPRGEIAY